MKNIKETSGRNQCIIINRKLARSIGLMEAVILEALLEKYTVKETADDGYFACTVEDLQNATTLTRYVQERVIKKLCDLGFVFKKLKGAPALRCFKINFGRLWKTLKEQKEEKEQKHANCK